MGMSGRLLRPRQNLHPDAASWASRVVANGGSVGSSLPAVNTFCKAIAAAGIRDRFYRLNLFCGASNASLDAVRTPLFRGPSLSGTQYGNTMDTNANFVAGDYAETGSSGGLTGNGTTKYLATGLVPFNAGMTEQNYHNSGYFPAVLNTSGDWIGATVGPATSSFLPAFSTFGMYVRFGGGSSSGIENGALSARSGHLIGQRSSGTGVGYRNGANIGASSVTSGSAAFATNAPAALNVFGRNANGTPSNYWSGRACMYSIGIQFTDAQALAFYNAVQAFQAALGRQL